MNFATPPYVLSGVLWLCLAMAGCGDSSDQGALEGARASLAKKDTATAIVQLKAFLQNSPQSGEGRRLLGQALLSAGDPAAAVLELEKALELGHPTQDVLPSLARALVKSGQPKTLTDTYCAVSLEDRAASAELSAACALASFAQDQSTQGEAYIRAGQASNPDDSTIKLLDARLIAGTGRVDEALARVDGILRESPGFIEGWLLKGELLRSGKSDLAGSAQAFRETLKLEPASAQAHAGLLAIALQSRDTPAFKRQFEELKRVLPNSGETRIQEAQLAVLEGDAPKAREMTQQLLRIAPDNVRLLQMSGAIELNGGSLFVAETSLVKALQRSPKLHSARKLLAQVYLRSGKPDRAILTLLPLLELKPDPETLALAGEAYLADGQLSKSEALFSRASEEKPGDAKILTSLALAQIAKGEIDTGQSDLAALADRDTTTYPDLALITSLLSRQDLDGALRAVQKLETKTPQAALPFQIRGQILAQKKDIAGARTSFEKALANEPSYYSAVAALAALDMLENKRDAALKRFEAELVRDPRNYKAMLGIAELRRRGGADPASVQAALADAVRAAPAEVMSHLTLVEHLLAQRDFNAARTAAQAGLAAVPDDPRLLDALGRTQLGLNDVQQAITNFKRVAAAQPSVVQPQLRLAQAHLQNRDRAAAVVSLKRALEIEPGHLIAQGQLVQIAIADKRFDDAISFARTVQKAQPKDSIGHLLEAEVHLARSQWAMATTALRNGLEARPASSIAVRLHSTLVRAKNDPEAERFAARWVQQQPQDVRFRHHLGSMALARGNVKLAESEYRAVLALAPDDADTLNNLAWVLARQGRKEAVALAEKANALAPGLPAFMDTLAEALAVEERWTDAIRWQRQAVAKAGGSPGFKLRLAKLLIKGGNKDEARVELESLKRLGAAYEDQAEVSALLASMS